MDKFYIEARREAQNGLAQGGIPIGAVLVYRNEIIGRGHNQRIQKGSAILHGEMAALEDAGRLDAATLRETKLYTTLSPCPMCTGACLLYKIPHIIIGENKNFTGAEDSLRREGVKVDVLQDAETILMMRNFITQNPDLWNEDISLENSDERETKLA